MRTRRLMPKKSQIKDYWKDVLVQVDKVTCIEDVMEFDECFACGWAGSLQRAHIVPKCEGGSDDVHNLHILCRYCHEVSETMQGDEYWQWFIRRQYADTVSVVMNNTCGREALSEMGKMCLEDYCLKYPHMKRWIDAGSDWVEGLPESLFRTLNASNCGKELLLTRLG